MTEAACAHWCCLLPRVSTHRDGYGPTRPGALSDTASSSPVMRISEQSKAGGVGGLAVRTRPSESLLSVRIWWGAPRVLGRTRCRRRGGGGIIGRVDQHVAPWVTIVEYANLPGGRPPMAAVRA